MDSNKTKLLILTILLFFISFYGYSNEKIDTMCGSWTHRNERNGKFLSNYWSLSIEKISNDKYFILYASNAEDHILDLSTVGTVINDQLIHIHKEEGEDFYVYLDYEYDSVYFLWNHTEPDSCYNDVELKRVTELYDEELNERKQLEYEERLKKSVLDYIKNKE